MVIATPIGAEGTSVSFNVNRVIHLNEYMKEKISFVVRRNDRKQGKNPSTID